MRSRMRHAPASLQLCEAAPTGRRPGAAQVREKEDRFQQRKIDSFFAARQPGEEAGPAPAAGADVDMEARPARKAHLMPQMRVLTSLPRMQAQYTIHGDHQGWRGCSWRGGW
jgi:hypothetical protein